MTIIADHYIIPQWPAPPHVKAVSTTRSGGHSKAPFASFNLSDYVDDHLENVKANRRQLVQELGLANEPVWLKQVHGTEVVAAETITSPINADASYTGTPGIACAILAADCLPILLCDRSGSQIAAIHAGWRGLLAGIIEKTIRKMAIPSQDLLAWLGPGIGPEVYEIDTPVYTQFVQADPRYAKAFAATGAGKWLADIYQIAKLQLAKANVAQIYGGEFCTYTDAKRFYSYRRDGGKTGRMATLICIDHRSRK